ncbi:MAG: hypothetical protein SF069_17680 [Phycisphaerae bacterium]|nr:hypothetical protein [Phycisphaerae bacterium]
MAFEVVQKLRSADMPRGLSEGEVTVNRVGDLRILAGDGALVAIDKFAVVLADALTQRVGLRAAREDDEPAAVVSVRPADKRSKVAPGGGCRLINIRHAIKRCGFEPKAVAGRYQAVVKEDELIYIQLAPQSAAAGKSGGAAGGSRANQSMKKAASKAV